MVFAGRKALRNQKIRLNEDVMKTILYMLTISLLLPLTGCPALFGKSDYDSHTQARVEFKQSDDSRLVAQSQSIERMATSPTKTDEGAAYQKAFGMMAIGMLKNQEYGERAPMTIIEGTVEVAKIAVPITVNAASNTAIAREGLKAAGNVEIGQGATVTDSLNKPSATSIGSGAVATVQPYEVRPEVVEPVVVTP